MVRWQAVRMAKCYYHVAIVGSGPAGMYTADRLLNKQMVDALHVYDMNPVPYGLVRYGVAPDHPDVKQCSHKFDSMLARDNVRFYGNIAVGRDISIEDLRTHYHAVILAYGAQSDKQLRLPNEHLGNIYSARSIVNWYNGEPCARFPVDLTLSDTAVIIGHGNVALDVARMLLTPIDHLTSTDMADHALASLSRSRIRHVHLVGRRGPLQVSFTTAELREIFKLPDMETHFSQYPRLPKGDIISLDRPKQRLMQLLENTAQRASNNKANSHRNHLYLDFFLQPTSFVAGSTGLCTAVQFEKTELVGGTDAAAPCHGTGQYEVIPCGLVVKSVGYMTVPMDGVPFDYQRGYIPNREGRVIMRHEHRDGDSECTESVMSGLYVSGWAKRGAVGVLAATMYDAYETADAVAQDLRDLCVSRDTKKEGCEALMKERQLKYVSFQEYRKIDEEEQRRGALLGKPRVKIVDVTEMLSIAGK